jgi:Fe-S-cluster containining protein
MTRPVADIPSCFGCGACCRGLRVKVSSKDIARGLPEKVTRLTIDNRGFYVRLMKQTEDKRCRALDPDTSLCTVYEVRPDVCREFERGGDMCIGALEGRRV